ncbi:MAG TPA: alkaline phosphatase family protein [Candidatus Nitrosotalea sp.]|nr:alkaline phosphatase family protein [Candidatus Nitrosotalea sp.]
MKNRLRTLAACTAAALLLSACGGSAGGFSSVPRGPASHRHHGSSMPIQHIVLIVQENRSFNNLFAGFPGATSTKTGKELVLQGSKYVQKPIKLKKVALTDHGNVTHLYKAFQTACDLQGSTCAMDGFDLIRYVRNNKPEGKAPYQYVNPNAIVPYWAMAKQWGLANAMFQTQGSDSFTAHQELIRGGTCITPVATCKSPSASSLSLIDPPTSGAVWGCDSPYGATTPEINVYGQVSTGPFPCSNKFPDYASGGYETLRDVLDAQSVSWKYYTPVWKNNTPSALWNAFDVIAPVRYGPEWTANVVSPETTIFSDITGGTLPAMSWVIPSANNSDHPGYPGQDTGPSWVASLVNAIGSSSYWNSTAIIVVWDDWGGFYDPVPPPKQDWQGGPGFRVPMIVISPYVQMGSGSQGGYISNTTYEFASIVRFVEDTFNLGRIPGTPDASSNSIADMFNFSQSPRGFTTIPSTYKKAYFLHHKPSELPVDTE